MQKFIFSLFSVCFFVIFQAIYKFYMQTFVPEPKIEILHPIFLLNQKLKFCVCSVDTIKNLLESQREKIVLRGKCKIVVEAQTDSNSLLWRKEQRRGPFDHMTTLNKIINTPFIPPHLLIHSSKTDVLLVTLNKQSFHTFISLNEILFFSQFFSK